MMIITDDILLEHNHQRKPLRYLIESLWTHTQWLERDILHIVESNDAQVDILVL